MLTADLALFRQKGSHIEPRLVPVQDPVVQRRAKELIDLVTQHQERTRGELDEALEAATGAGTDYKIRRGMAKLLLDRCEFATVSPLEPVVIRETVFRRARQHHPVSHEPARREQVLAEAAAELKTAPEVLAQSLYADRSEQQQLVRFDPLTPTELLDRYNLAQAQALLYRCVQLEIQIQPQKPEGYRRLFAAIKAYRLIHSIQGTVEEGYTIRLSGPVSLFHRSQKYGIQMAVFLPALLLCTGWQMRAEVESHFSGHAFFTLSSSQTQFRSHYLPAGPEGRPDLVKVQENWTRRGNGWDLQPCQTMFHAAGLPVAGVGRVALQPGDAGASAGFRAAI
jgi:uncharacterized protein